MAFSSLSRIFGKKIDEPKPSFKVFRPFERPQGAPPPVTYEGPPVNFVVFGCGQRAMSILPLLIGLSRGAIGRVVLADSSRMAVDTAASDLQAHLFISGAQETTIVEKFVLREGEDGQKDRIQALALPNERQVTDPAQQESSGAVPSTSSGTWNKWCLIASTNITHRPDCVAALTCGYNIFCEKPLATTIEDCKVIYDTVLATQRQAAEAGIPVPRFVTGFVLRHAVLYQRIHTLIHRESLTGKIISCEFNEILGREHGSYIFRNWRRFGALAGPNILEKSCHDLDVMAWLVGSVPVRVAAFGGLDIFKEENAEVAAKLAAEADEELGEGRSAGLFRHWPTHPPVESPFTAGGDIEDNLVAIIEYRNGARTTFHLNSFSAIRQRRLFLCGLEGTVLADLKTGDLEAKRISGAAPRGAADLTGNAEQKSSDLHGGGDHHMIVKLWEEVCAVGKEWDTIAPSAPPSAGNSDMSRQPVDEPPKTATTSDHSATIKDMYVAAVTALAIDLARRERRVVDVETEFWRNLDI
ncbi:hypothetical protein HDU93_000333 [Gonapodya sp. JEL0774]|nr:hypothetical protein HDU93_000333 [Gonapodya sp. JEL0774]